MCGRKTTVAEYSVVKELWKLTSVSKLYLHSSRDDAAFELMACHERGGEAAESNGGEYRARTGDLLVANQALSQLS